ncbi:TIR-NBS-LRR RCT1 resistance protein, partial [Trifolium medium]|nr:TIR-NBS-LRR RCT1 resistance protein [Trifolium medium]
MQITSHAVGLYADVVGLIQRVPHYLDQPAEVVAEEIPAAEVQVDLEHQVPPPEGEPEQQPTVAPEAIEPTLGAQILDAIRELRADFSRQEQTVTARFNAVEVRLDGIEDV